MKKFHFKVLTLMVILFGITSCKKYLNTIPVDFLTPSQYYQTEAQLNLALIGVYDQLGAQGLYQNYFWTSLCSGNDIDYWRAPSANASSILLFNETSADGTINTVWNTIYAGINRANSLLDAIDDSPVSASVKNPIKAQAKFLRGYYYFLLVSNWGGVPLRLHATTSVADASCPRSTIAEVYAQVLKDMTEAEPLLPTITKLGPVGSGKISKTACEGILARVCLSMAGEPLKDVSKFVDAKNWALKVINSGEHALNPDYRQIFINHCADIYDTKESMWEVEFDVTNIGKSEWGTLGTSNTIKFTNIDYGYGYGTFGVTKKFWDLASVTPNDLRRDWTLAPFNLGGATTGISGVTKSPLSQTTLNIWNRYPGKWRREFEVYTPRGQGANGINYPLLRYADVLLMYAEAVNEVDGPNAEAYKAINLVRERAQGTGNRISGYVVTNGGTGYTSAPTVTISAPNLGNGATATATVTGGKITAIAQSNIGGAGAFYTSAPVITLTGGGGSGAVITATLTAIVPSSADLTPGLSQDQFRLAVQDERTVELCQEGLRKHDMIRWGILLSSMKTLSANVRLSASTIPAFQFVAQPGDNITEREIFLPIPISELTLNKALNGVNNPGY